MLVQVRESGRWILVSYHDLKLISSNMISPQRTNILVTGIDLSPIQPNFVPPNLKFYVDDAEDGWIVGEKLDLIHARMMVGSFLNWPQFFARAYEQLNPGGYVELQDVIGQSMK